MNKFYLIFFVILLVACDDSSSVNNKTECTPEKVVSCAAGTHNEYNLCVDDSEEITIDKTTFLMGGFDGDNTEHVVTLNSFIIDKFEISNKKYAACVKNCICTPPTESISYSSRFQYSTAEEFKNYPAVYITWEQAQTYCAGIGKSLPTEAQWELSARSKDGYKYPWGDESPARSMANYDQPMLGDTVEVGSYDSGASAYGVMDLAGNVWEWTYDFYNDDYYENSPSTDPKGPETGINRVVRGGCFASGEEQLLSTRRNKYQPDSSYSTVGFRCVRTGGNK